MTPATCIPLPRTRTARAMGRTRLFGILLLLPVLAGCMGGFVYNRLDWVVSWYINGLVSLDEAQEAELRAIVRRTLEWHRQTQMPRYVALLERLQVDVTGPMTAELIERRYRETVVMMDDLLDRLLPDAASLLMTLSAAQVAELEESFAEDIEEMREEYSGATAEIRQKRRARNAVRAIQRFTGPLDREQRALVEARIAGMHDLSEQWLERRGHWQERFLALLRSPKDPAAFTATLRGMILDPNQFDAPGYRVQVEQNQRVIFAMLAEVVNGLDERQRSRLGRRFRELSEDLRRIEAGG